MSTSTGTSARIAIDDGGKSQNGELPVLFLHSFEGSSAQWKPQLEHLRKNRRAIAMDLRGHGQSFKPENNDYAINSFASDVGDVLDSHGIDRVVLVGHSLGGDAAISYAAAAPHRVAGLVVEGTSGKMDDEQAKPMLAQLDADFDKTMEQIWTRLLTNAAPSTRELVTSDNSGFSTEAAKAMIKATFTDNPAPKLRQYPGPKLSIVAKMDDVPFALHKQVPGLPVKAISGTSHWMHLDKPDEFNAILDAFLDSLA